jgi:hypothetical protein
VNLDELSTEAPRRLTRGAKIRIGLAVAAGCVILGAGIYARYLAPKSPLGGPCKWAMNCLAEAPKCMRASLDGEGVCSRQCELGQDCQEGIRCVEIELEERDPRGVPLKSGYCFPQSFIDAKKGKPATRDAGPPSDSWLPVPESTTQLEGEVVMQGLRAGTPSEPKTYLVKGTLVRAMPASKTSRTIADASGMRLFVVDDEKKTFTPTALEGGGQATIDKTTAKDRVADRDCDVWKIDDGKTRREACVLIGGAFLDPGGHTAPAWQRELSVRGAFPLRVVELDKNGREVARTSVLRLDLHPVDAALFTIPKSYKNLAH